MTWRAHNPAPLSRTPVQRNEPHKAAVKQQQAVANQQSSSNEKARRQPVAGSGSSINASPNPNGA